MKKLLGTLQVWLDMDETRMPSGITQVSEREWDLIMRPSTDHRLLSATAGRAGFQTIMAHEMGHFIAQITLDPVSDKRNWTYSIILPDGSKMPSPLSVLGEEKLAWKLARVINPDLVPNIEEYALRGYQQGAEDEAFETGQLDRLQNFFTLPEPEPDTFDDSDRWEDDGGTYHWTMPDEDVPFETPVDGTSSESYWEENAPLTSQELNSIGKLLAAQKPEFHWTNDSLMDAVDAMDAEDSAYAPIPHSEPSEPTEFQRFLCEWAAKNTSSNPCRANMFPQQPKAGKVDWISRIARVLFVFAFLLTVGNILATVCCGVIEVL